VITTIDCLQLTGKWQVHKSDLESCNLDLVRISSSKYTSFFVLRFVYIHHSQTFLKLAAPGQSVIVQESLCPYVCGVTLLLDLAQRWLPSRFEHPSIIVYSIRDESDI
jgi:hypothetical protein